MSVYDIAKIQRQVLDMFPEHDPPRIEPRQLAPLIDYLAEVTRLALEHKTKVAGWLTERAGSDDLWAQYYGADRALMEWLPRMRGYQKAISECQASNDPACTLWSVTAPLFFGYFGGAQSKEPQQPSDLMQPFIIANMLGNIVNADATSNAEAAITSLNEAIVESPALVSDFVAGTLRGFGEAIGAGVGGIGTGVGDKMPWVIAAALGGLGLWFIFRKKVTE